MIVNNAADLVEPDIRSMNPWRIIKESAESQGIKIHNPKPNCKKCYGRGWIGRVHETGEPIACNCIIEKEEFASKRELGDWSVPVNREQRRAAKKNKN